MWEGRGERVGKIRGGEVRESKGMGRVEKAGIGEYLKKVPHQRGFQIFSSHAKSGSYVGGFRRTFLGFETSKLNLRAFWDSSCFLRGFQTFPSHSQSRSYV